MILVHKMKIGEVVGRDSCITATLEWLNDVGWIKLPFKRNYLKINANYEIALRN